MSRYTLSKRSHQDIQEIAEYSLSEFGETQTKTYMAGLKEKIALLSEQTDLGRDFTHTRSQRVYKSYRYQSHVIYYRKREHDIFIVRILHIRMLPEKHL